METDVLVGALGDLLRDLADSVQDHGLDQLLLGHALTGHGTEVRVNLLGSVIFDSVQQHALGADLEAAFLGSEEVCVFVFVPLSSR